MSVKGLSSRKKKIAVLKKRSQSVYEFNSDFQPEPSCKKCNKYIDREHVSMSDPNYHDACLNGKIESMHLKRRLSCEKLNIKDQLDIDMVRAKIRADKLIGHAKNM